MSIPRICLQKNLTDSTALPCSVNEFISVMQSEEVQRVCDEIKIVSSSTEKYDKEEINKLKRQLPAITPHACKFKDNHRKNENAIQSGLVMIDIDGVESPDTFAGKRCHGKTLRDLKVYMVAKTPSGHGIRIIAERQKGEDLVLAQRRIADHLRIFDYDVCTKDLARLSYVMPWSYVYYFDEKGFEWKDEKAAEYWMTNLEVTNPELFLKPSKEELKSASKTQSVIESNVEKTDFPKDFRGVSYDKIINELIILHGGMPVVGERNNFYFSLCVDTRYICDFNKDFILSVLPDFGLSFAERQNTCISALSRVRRNHLPELVERAIALAKNTEAKDAEAVLDEDSKVVGMSLPGMPVLLKTICKKMPEQFRPAMIIASLPVLGTLATGVRFKYLDEQTHSFSFMSCITAPAASGKSFIRKPIELLLTPINEQDAIEREKERKYKEELKSNKNKQKQPEDPRACPRNNGLNISIAALLKLLTYSGGKHLIGIGEEIDTLSKSEKAGVWSQKSDIYRLSFDNSVYGQQYISDNSFSANVNVYYNLLVTGTPAGMYRFFNNVENGLVTRVAFAELPDMFACDIPKFMDFTDDEKNFIIEESRRLCEQNGMVECLQVNDAISNWLKVKQELALKSDSRSIDVLRKRSAVIGFRAGYLCYVINNLKNPKMAKNFAIWVADYVFDNQMRLFGKLFDESFDNLSKMDYSTQTKDLLSFLPVDFSKNDLIGLRVKMGKPSSVSMILSRWVSRGLVKKISETNYKKI